LPGTCVHSPLASQTPAVHALVALHALPGVGSRLKWPNDAVHTGCLHSGVASRKQYGAPFLLELHTSPVAGPTTHCPAALQVCFEQVIGDVPLHGVPTLARAATQTPLPSQMGVLQPTIGPHDVPAAANSLASQPAWALQVPGEQTLPPTLHAAPTAGIAMHLAAPSQVPTPLSHGLGAATAQVAPSGRDWTLQPPFASHRPT
jgi:hypothetical protein